MNIFANLKFLTSFVQQAVLANKVSTGHRVAIEKNIHYRSQIGWNHDDVLKALGSDSVFQEDDAEFVRLVEEYQKDNGLGVDGIVGPATYQHMMSSLLTEAEKAIENVFDMVIMHESGGNYSAMNRDGEFRGLFDKTWIARHGKPHPASGKIHIGLSFGSIQFTQDGGSLGKLLDQCCKKNPIKFKQVMGDTGGQLLKTLTTPGPSGLSSGKLRGPRVHPVQIQASTSEAIDIWEKPWTDRFQKLGDDAEFQAVQRQLALDEYLKPVLPFLKEKGMTSEKSVACALDGCVHRGVGGFRTLIRKSNAKTEKEILTYLGNLDKRFGRIVKSSLSSDVWKGWEHYQ